LDTASNESGTREIKAPIKDNKVSNMKCGSKWLTLASSQSEEPFNPSRKLRKADTYRLYQDDSIDCIFYES
jgi:hypothetical protein